MTRDPRPKGRRLETRDSKTRGSIRGSKTRGPETRRLEVPRHEDPRLEDSRLEDSRSETRNASTLVDDADEHETIVEVKVARVSSRRQWTWSVASSEAIETEDVSAFVKEADDRSSLRMKGDGLGP